MTDFWDTSALAKLYLPERGSGWAAARLATDGVAISTITFVEMASLLGRRFLRGELSDEQRDVVYRRFLSDTAEFGRVDLAISVVAIAAQLSISGAAGRAIHTLDSIQLASARKWFEEMNGRTMQSGAFITADRQLGAAAGALGMITDNPEDHA